jgi:APA family basic amino acid/polyamine antiporter
VKIENLFARKPFELLLAEGRQSGERNLRRALGATDLVAMGIGIIVGAGLFSLTGVVAAENAGPALAISMIVAAIGCAFAALCYSEFASMIPVAGSAYTYAYATLGEWVAWIIGWDLILEYAVGAATVSISWSAYLASLLRDLGINLPPRLTAGPFESLALHDGRSVQGVINLPAALIVVVLSVLLMAGIRESARANAVMVLIKVSVVLVFVSLGSLYIHRANYTPFVPPNTGTFGHFGISGIMAGAGTIFFAYLGFDAVSTAAQEARNPKRDMPIGILGSLGVCTLLYVLFAIVLTGMVSYTRLGVAAPVAMAIDQTPYGWLRGLIKIGVLCGFTSVILIILFGQSRVFLSMSRDGLVPRFFSDIHPRFRTPWLSNIFFMGFVASFAALLPISVAGHMSSIGALFAFVVVSASVWILRHQHPELSRPFRTPWVPFVPLVGIALNFSMMYSLGWTNWARLLVWLALGQVIYFSYARRHSRVREALKDTKIQEKIILN